MLLILWIVCINAMAAARNIDDNRNPNELLHEALNQSLSRHDDIRLAGEERIRQLKADAGNSLPYIS
jgi:hypothetical protein